MWLGFKARKWDSRAWSVPHHITSIEWFSNLILAKAESFWGKLYCVHTVHACVCCAHACVCVAWSLQPLLPIWGTPSPAIAGNLWASLAAPVQEISVFLMLFYDYREKSFQNRPTKGHKDKTLKRVLSVGVCTLKDTVNTQYLTILFLGMLKTLQPSWKILLCSSYSLCPLTLKPLWGDNSILKAVTRVWDHVEFRPISKSTKWTAFETLT